MKDYMEIGSVPASEPCAQVGNDDYTELSRKECHVFKEQLLRIWGEKLLPGMYFTIKTFPHDFGSYREVCIVYDDNNEAQCDMAIEIQNEMPEKWDSEALAELKEIGYALPVKG